MKRLYVVDNRQNHHFEQLFLVLQKMGYPALADAIHVSYGFLKLPEGAMSTRKGTVMLLADLVQETKEAVLQIIRQKNPELKGQEEVAFSITLGALKFFDLIHEPSADIVFTKEKVLSFEGMTGPYVQYTYARLASILRKNSEEYSLDTLNVASFLILERPVVRQLTFFPEIVDRAAAEFRPHYIALYLYETAQLLNTWYHAAPVLKEADPLIRQFRLALIQAGQQVLANGMRLLGIPILEAL